jgi:hypothetical protein
MTETNRANEMSNCPVSSQIADHVNSEPVQYCYQCDQMFTEDDNSTEVKTINGYKHVHDECLEDFMEST